MLKQHAVEYRYRDYRDQPLSEREIRGVLRKLGLGPREVLRRNDKAFRELGLGGDEPAARLIGLMAEHPTLLQRPIGVLGSRAALGRPPENLLTLVRKKA